MVSHTFLGCRRGGLGESESSRLSPPPSFSARRHLPADASGGATQLAADLVVFSTRPMTPAQTRASLLATWRPLTPIARSSNAGSKLVFTPQEILFFLRYSRGIEPRSSPKCFNHLCHQATSRLAPQEILRRGMEERGKAGILTGVGHDGPWRSLESSQTLLLPHLSCEPLLQLQRKPSPLPPLLLSSSLGCLRISAGFVMIIQNQKQ
jgi:hypothetical protein